MALLKIVLAGASRDRHLAKFIVYDTVGQSGQKLPIWGGCDTLTEHILNRLADVLVRRDAQVRRTSASGEAKTWLKSQTVE